MSDDWGTPDWLMSMFEDWYDPCPLKGIKSKDGLNESWADYYDKIYINPPYSNPKPWIEKAIREFEIGQLEDWWGNNMTIVLLLKHDSSTQWYRMLKEAGARFLMVEGRLTYKGPNSKPCAFPSVLAVLS